MGNAKYVVIHQASRVVGGHYGWSSTPLPEQMEFIWGENIEEVDGIEYKEWFGYSSPCGDLYPAPC